MRSVFNEEDIELMLAIRREEEARASNAAKRSSRSKRPASSRTITTTPDPEAASRGTRTKP
jgi:hypothetical protein